MHLLSLKILKMLKMRFVVVMDTISMGIGYGWNLHTVAVDIHHQEIVIAVIAVVAVEVDVVEYPGALNFVCSFLDCLLLLHGKTLRITCDKLGMFVFPKFSVMVAVQQGLWIMQTMKT
jgi:hypothetical protein